MVFEIILMFSLSSVETKITGMSAAQFIQNIEEEYKCEKELIKERKV